jgi:filamentous hemagglutinin
VGSGISGTQGVIVAGAAGAVVGGGAGAFTASNADMYNRQLHPEERTLIANAANEIAASQAQNPADQAQIAAYWNNMLTLVANADVDAQSQQQLNQTVTQMTQAAQASGNYQALQTFQQNLATAQQIVQGMAGQSITNSGGPVVADDGVLKTFQATGSQYNDSSLFGTPGGTKVGLASGETPASVGIGPQYYGAPNGPTNQQVNAFANDLLQQAATPNGAVTPVYPAESVVLGNMAGKIAAGALGAVFGSGAESATQAVATNTAEGAANSVNGARLGMQLSAEEAAGTQAPTSISSYSNHALQQIAGRDGGIGVSQAAVDDAFANPTAIQYVPSTYGPTFKYIGQNATVVVNPQGNVVTTWGTSAAGVGK